MDRDRARARVTGSPGSSRGSWLKEAGTRLPGTLRTPARSSVPSRTCAQSTLARALWHEPARSAWPRSSAGTRLWWGSFRIELRVAPFWGRSCSKEHSCPWWARAGALLRYRRWH